MVDPSRIKDSINRLDNFDGHAIGKAVEAKLYQEVFAIFKKSNLNVQFVVPRWMTLVALTR